VNGLQDSWVALCTGSMSEHLGYRHVGPPSCTVSFSDAAWSRLAVQLCIIVMTPDVLCRADMERNVLAAQEGNGILACVWYTIIYLQMVLVCQAIYTARGIPRCIIGRNRIAAAACAYYASTASLKQAVCKLSCCFTVYICCKRGSNQAGAW
jgi:hypothetical protein